MSAPALPTKKRKPSTASSAESEIKAEEASRIISESRLPSKKRKGSHDSAVQESSQASSRRKFEHASRKTSQDSTERKSSLDISSDDDLRNRKWSQDLSVHFDSVPRKESYDSLKIDELAPLPADLTYKLPETYPQTSAALDHLDALATKDSTAKRKDEDDDTSASQATYASSGQRLLLEAIMMKGGSDSVLGEQQSKHSYGRDRLESWGGMSDLSVGGYGHADSASTLAHSALQQAGIIDDHAQAAYLHDNGHNDDDNEEASFDLPTHEHIEESHRKSNAVPTRISLDRGRLNSIASNFSLDRERLNSIASLGDLSLSNLPMMLEGVDVSGDLQAFVAAAVAQVGDQLAEIATAVEAATNASRTESPNTLRHEAGLESDASVESNATPIIGALSDGRTHRGRHSRPRSWSVSSGKISVDYEAVAAAVNAAEAATGTLDLSNIGQISNTHNQSNAQNSKGTRLSRRQLPLRTRQESDASSSSEEIHSKSVHISEKDKEGIRERARLAAGYIPPRKMSHEGSNRPVPIKKRAKRDSPLPNETESYYGTPKHSNKKIITSSNGMPPIPVTEKSSSEVYSSAKSSKGQSSQKWETMYEALLEFVEERREEETKGFTEKEKAVWVWDGNVPTTYKTKDGKALGRWVNNQRSARSKGALKDDREQRLVDAGLKWSVLASNTWNLMLEELRVYIDEQARLGRKWDGNVPTNYQIKTKPNGRLSGEDKNLGRWVNRQRSLFQSGKLRKDRQIALEKMGLKWSMLATNTWESMYESLLNYIEDRKRESDKNIWDGNVPANYRTDEDPPKALGRWINRQRSAYTKCKLKREYVDKLNAVGLKWSVHERNSSGKRESDVGDDYDDYDDDYYDDDDDDDDVSTSATSSGKPTKVTHDDDVTNKASV